MGITDRICFLVSLIPKATDIMYLTAICMDCFSDAPFTKRITSEDGAEVIGSIDKYKPICRKCLVNDNFC